MPLTVADLAPSFRLPATDGTEISLAALCGKKAVIYFYPKDDTSGCTREGQDFQSLLGAFSAIDTAIVGISADSPASHDRFRTKYGFTFPLASDESKDVLKAYGVWVEKRMYGRTYMGVERTTVLVDRDGRVARIWPKVKVPGHAQEVLAAAQAL